MFCLLVAFVIAASFKSAIADWNDVPTGSMKPTILEGDRVFINKLAYDLKVPCTTRHLAKWADPGRGDIVVFNSPADGKRLVKRVVGMPGDVIAMHNNKLYINGEPVSYQALEHETIEGFDSEKSSRYVLFLENLENKSHPVAFIPLMPAMRSFGPLNVPVGQYFMMGDNRDNSADSRFFGFVSRKQIRGRVLAVVISRDKSFLHPRWQRFFFKLS
ncbi:MAG: signal peptidase I [Deltaproteobacteria bacterium]|nr:signal peptidase I [Deltaproteobacteria bacterium]